MKELIVIKGYKQYSSESNRQLPPNRAATELILTSPKNLSLITRNTGKMLIRRWQCWRYQQAALYALYKLISLRLAHNISLSANYRISLNSNPILEQMLELLEQRLVYSGKVAQLFVGADYIPKAHIDIISISERCGANLADVFALLSEVIERERFVRTSIIRTITIPIIVLLSAYIMGYISLVYFLPLVNEKLTGELSNSFSNSQIFTGLFDFVRLFNQSLLISSIVYFCILPIGLAVLVYWQREKLLNLIRPLKLSKQYVDWLCFSKLLALFYLKMGELEAVRLANACLTSKSVKIQTNKILQFCSNGNNFSQAISYAVTDKFVQQLLLLANHSGNLRSGLAYCCAELQQKINEMLFQLKQLINILAMIFAAIAVFSLLFISYVPYLLAVKQIIENLSL